MMQPFILFESKYLDKLLSLKRIYFVTQSYHRAFNPFDDQKKIDLLVTDYDNPGLAKIHYNAIKNDKFGAIILLENETHLHNFSELLTNENYRVFWSVVKKSGDIKRILELKYKDKLRRYIDNKLKWKIAREEGGQFDGFKVIFGELFVYLKWRTQKQLVKFEDIEKY